MSNFSDPPTLEECITFIAEMDRDGATELNGVGFSGYDTNFGHSLAAQAGRWSPKQRRAAYRLAYKYRRQLADFGGVDMTVIPVPE